MITPSQLMPYTPTTREQKLATLENAIDNAILRSDHTGSWPARVRRMRTQIPPDVVRELADRYAMAGWRVEPFPEDGECYLIIDRPEGT